MHKLHPRLCIPEELILVLEHLLNKGRQFCRYYILDKLVLSVQDYVTKLAEVFDYDTCLIALHKEKLARETYKNFVVINKLCQQRIQNSEIG